MNFLLREMPGTGLSKIVVDCGERLLGVDEPAGPSPGFPLEVAVCGTSIVGNSRYAARFLSRAKS